MKKILLGILVVLAVSAAAVTFMACGKRGDGEKAGEKLDDAMDQSKDVFEKDGPMEKAGEKVDHAVDGK